MTDQPEREAPTAKEIEIIKWWQSENAACRNATEEAECFLGWMRTAVAAERELQAKAWESGFRHCLEWYEIWREIGAMQRPIKECLPQDGRMESDLAAIRKDPTDD